MDASTDEFVVVGFIVPTNYVNTTAPTLEVYYKCVSDTSGTAAFEARVACMSDGDSADADANAFDTVNAATASIPGTAGHIDVMTITLTNRDSMAAGDWCIIALNRNISADDVTGDIEFFAADFHYTNV